MTTTISLTNPTTVRIFSKFTFLDPEKILDRYAADLDNFVTNTDGNVSEAAILSKISERDNIILGEIQRRLDMNGLMTSDKINTKLEAIDNNLAIKTRGIMTELVPQLLETFAAKIKQDFTTNTAMSPERLEQILHATESHMMQRFDATQQKITESAVKQDQLTSSMSEFMAKKAYTRANATMKGQASELELFDVLTEVFVNLDAEVVRCSGTDHMCDFFVTRPDRGTILVENKCYETLIPTKEVVKFKNDLVEHKCHGIFLSQHSHISGIKQYIDVQFDAVKNIVQVYMSCVEYDHKFIKFGIRVLDSHVDMVNQLKRVDKVTPEYAIPLEKMQDFYTDYLKTTNGNRKIVKMLNDAIKELDSIAMPNIHGFLKQHGLIPPDPFTCIYCNAYVGKNQSSLSAHLRNSDCNAKMNAAAGIEPKKEKIAEVCLDVAPLVKTVKRKAATTTTTAVKAAVIDEPNK